MSAAVASAAVVVPVVAVVLAARVDRATISADVARRLDELKRTTRRPANVREQVLLIGDSVLGVADGPSVADETRRRISADPRGRDVSTSVFWWPGLLVTSEWCLADDFLEFDADRVVLEVNLRSLGAGTALAFGFPELAGRVRADRFVEGLSLPLSVSGITAGQMLFDRALVVTGLEDAWTRVVDAEARVYNLRDRADRALDALLAVHSVDERRGAAFQDGLARFHVPGKLRERREHVAETLWNVRLGVAPSYPPFRILGALVRRFADAGKHPLVWAAPVNVDHYRSIGVDVSGFARSVESMRAVVEENGGRLLDLHTTLRDAQLGDASDHATAHGPGAGTAALGAHLAQGILDTEAR
ncbi:MAG TPA: hypothetical protein VHE30_03045 [Polyangiaceae bacterium]|nr:hypothetical protein [Polyangiaceae bacterium]